MSISAGSAPGSTALGQTGAELFAWNGVDVSQFEATAAKHSKTVVASPGGGNADTALALTVVDRSAEKLGNVLRMTATALAGGGVFGVLASLVTLPDRYMIGIDVLDVGGASPSNIRPATYVMYDPSVPGSLNGLELFKQGGFNVLTFAGVVNGLQKNGHPLTSSGTFTLDPRISRKGGFRQIIEVYRQRTSDNPALFAATVEERRGEGGFTFDGVYEVNSAVDIGANWNGLNMNRVGIGCWETNDNTSATCDFKNFAVYAHPDD